jgi:uncharacterized protein YpuA (DUF1002 family)
MCIMCAIKEGVAHAVGLDVKRTVVGKLDQFTIARLQEIGEEKDQLEDKIEARRAELMEKVKQQLAEEFEADYNNLGKRQRAIFDRFYERLGLDKSVEYHVDPKTQEVFKEEVTQREKSTSGKPH